MRKKDGKLRRWKTRYVLLAVLMFTVSFYKPQSAAAFDPTTTSMDTLVKTYLYGNWLRACLVQANKPLTLQQVASYDWFSSSGGNRALGVVAVNGTQGASSDCTNKDLVRTAVSTLGLGTDNYATLCELGYVTYAYSITDVKPCKGIAQSAISQTNTAITANNDNYASKLKIDNIDITSYRIFTPFWGVANQPNMADSTHYWLYYKTFMLACNPTEVTGTPPTNQQIATIRIINPDGSLVSKNYAFTNNGKEQVDTYVGIGPSFTDVAPPCSDLASWANQDKNVNAYRTWAQSHASLASTDSSGLSTAVNAATGNAPTAGKPSCSGGALGWVLCPLLKMFNAINENVTKYMETMLKTQPLSTGSAQSNALMPIWRIVVGFANLALVIAFLIVIFSQATSFGLSAYGIKKMLPRIIAAAVLINLSFFICAIALDITNVIGASIQGIIKVGIDAIPAPPGSDNMAWTAGDTVKTAGLALGGLTGAVMVGAIGYILPVIIMGAMAVLILFMGIALRQILIILLILVSPLAFVAMILPGTEPYFKKWYSNFMKLLLMYPVIMAIMYGCALLSKMVMSVGVQ